jgi:hypothetical protein
MNRYVSEPFPHPRTHGEGTPYGRVDVVFEDVDASGDSYYGLVFLNAPDADHTTTEEEAQLAGWFTVFGHGGCVGDDASHCAPTGPMLDPALELRLPPGIPRQTKTVTITEAVRGVTDEQFTLTVVAVAPGDEGPRASDDLDFGRLRLLTYE